MSDNGLVVQVTVPHSLEAEASVLGSILINPESLADVAAFLSPFDFYILRNRYVFEAILAIDVRGDAIDNITVVDELRVQGRLQDVGGSAYITGLLNDTPTHIHVETYARMVERAALRRKLLATSAAIARAALEENAEIEDVIDQAEALIYNVTLKGRRNILPSMREIVSRHYDAVEAMYNRTAKTLGIPTGFTELDQILSGLQKSFLYIVAARPGVGKTALMCNLATTAVKIYHMNVGFVSLEMNGDQLSLRLEAAESGINSKKISLGNLDEHEWSLYTEAVGKISRWTLHIDDTPGTSLAMIRARLRQWQREQGIDLLFVDYLQLVKGSGRGSTREQEVAEIARGLKEMAREFNIPVVAAAQLNRSVETRQDKRPTLADLRECVVGSTRVINARTGLWTPISDIKIGDTILGLSDRQKIAPFAVQDVWSTGVKPTFDITTRTGKRLTATENHPLLTPKGWRQVRDICPGDLIATALRLPEYGTKNYQPELCRLLGYMVGNGTYQKHREVGFIASDPDVFADAMRIVKKHFPEVTLRISPQRTHYQEVDFVRVFENGYGKPHGNPLREWLREISAFGQRDSTKRVPSIAFENCVNAGEFLSGYLSTDGCVKYHVNGVWEIHFDTVCRDLASDVQALLMMIGIASSVGKGYKGKKATRPIYRISVSSAARNLKLFASRINVLGKKGDLLNKMVSELPLNQTRGGALALPPEVSKMLAARSSWKDQGKRMGRERCAVWADRLDDDELRVWAESDLLWEEVASIDPAGMQEVFDVCVPDCGNFLANGIVAHNSGELENAADVVMFIYRDEIYDDNTERPGQADIIIAKHRQGEQGVVTLFYRKEVTQFTNMQRSTLDLRGQNR